MYQLITIKRAPQEAVIKFNLRFQRTWKRIPLSAHLPTNMAFIFYLKAFNFNKSVMIQSLGGNTLSQAFDLAVEAENNLIDVGKLVPRPLMLVFLELSNQVPEPAATPSSSTSQSMYAYPDPQQASLPPPSSLAVEVNDMKIY